MALLFHLKNSVLGGTCSSSSFFRPSRVAQPVISNFQCTHVFSWKKMGKTLRNQGFFLKNLVLVAPSFKKKIQNRCFSTHFGWFANNKSSGFGVPWAIQRKGHDNRRGKWRKNRLQYMTSISIHEDRIEQLLTVHTAHQEKNWCHLLHLKICFGFPTSSRPKSITSIACRCAEGTVSPGAFRQLCCCQVISQGTGRGGYHLGTDQNPCDTPSNWCFNRDLYNGLTIIHNNPYVYMNIYIYIYIHIYIYSWIV